MEFFKKHILWVAVIFIFVIEIGIGLFAFRLAVDKEQQSLVERTQSIAAALDGEEIKQLRGDSSDIGTPAYEDIKRKLINIGEVNEDVISVYITGYRNGEIFFFADSVANNEVGEATPGLVYDEGTPLFKSVFTEGISTFEGHISDRWGSWVSGLAPILDAEGVVVGSIGMDVESNVYKKEVFIATAVPVLLFGIVSLILLFGYVRYIKNKELIALKARFISIASHELRSPIASIIWASESLLKRADDKLSSAASATVGLVIQTGHQILETITEIMDLASLQAAQRGGVKLEKVNMLGVILEITKSMTLTAREHEVSLQPDSSLPDRFEIFCDRAKTKRAVSNVISNAIKYSPKGGVITIGYRQENGWRGVTITDQGIGIPQAEQGQIFKENFRASNAEHSSIAGSGFGLNLVKELMEAQGGTISFSSKSGIGTTFFLAFKERQ